MISLPRKAWQEFVTAIAGPLVSFSISGLILVIDLLGINIANDWLFDVLRYAFWMNIMLGGFNLLPGFPMDGGRVFRSIMRIFTTRAKATLAAMWVGRAFAILLGLRGLHSIMSGGNWGFISILIAWMIWKEGMREYQQVLLDERYDNWSQDDFNARVSPPPYDL